MQKKNKKLSRAKSIFMRISRSEPYRIILHENVEIQRRGIIILLNKTCPLKLVYKEAIDLNCLKLSMKYDETTFGLFCTYAPSRGLDTDFLLKVRRN